MRKLIEFLIIVLELSILIISAKGYECKLEGSPPVDFFTPNATQIVSLIQSQILPADFLADVIKTEESAIADIFKFKLAENREDIHLNITELIQKYGYKAEEHEVTTEDGYILNIYRIKGEGPPVFLMHGLMSSAVDWITVGPGSAIPYYLADQGFDVWLGNARGTKYAMRHVTIPSKCAEFWDYSVHEIGVYDVSKMIDYVLDKTGKSSLAFIGHSEGTTTPLVLISERPEYNKKINLIIMLAPVAWQSHVRSPLLRILSLELQNIYKLLGNFGIPGDSIVIKTLLQLMCADTVVTKLLCSNIVFLAAGFGVGHMDINKMPVIASHLPGGGSVKEIVHGVQNVNSGQFRQFDYTKEKNMELYGQEEPPSYHVESVTAPVALFYSDSDWLSSSDDVIILRNNLPNVVIDTKMDKFAHYDYLVDRNADDNLHPKLRRLLLRYTK